MNNLGGVSRGEALYSDAKKMYQDALDIEHQVIGDQHPETLHSISGLAETAKAEGR